MKDRICLFSSFVLCPSTFLPKGWDMARKKSDVATLWRMIDQAGGIEAYIDTQLAERGLRVERRETEGLAAKELEAYKKALRAEAEERKKLRREAWKAFRATHIVHLGEGIHWSDENNRKDRWDLSGAEERAAENELPPIDTPQQLAERLELTVSELRWLAYHREAATRIHYRRFTIPKRD